MYLADDFRDALRAYDLQGLDDMDVTALGIRPDWTIGYVNAGWVRFARENGAPDPEGVWDPARPVVEAVPEPLRDFYADLYQRALESGREQSHSYECSSPTTFRRFHLRVIPLPDVGLLLLHHLEEERPMARTPGPPDESRYRDDNGFIVQCAQCRMVRRAHNGGTWDWVPEWVSSPDPETSHGLCPVCFAAYYPELAERYLADRADRHEQTQSVEAAK